MHILLTALGSYGDVLPMVGLGAAMGSRGHRVQVIVNPYFQKVVEDAGLAILPLGTADEYRALWPHPDLWHPSRGLKLVLTRGVAAYLRELYEIVESQYCAGETVIAAHGLDLASRIFHDKCHAPLATVHFAPFALFTVHQTPRYMNAPNMAHWPRWLKRAVFWAGDRALIEPVIGPTLNGLRAELGLPAIRRIFTRWSNSPDLVLGLFPDWFATPQPDWAPNTHLAGFPLWDRPAATELSPQVNDFLDAGEPPIVFAPGSANAQAEKFFHTAVDVCRRLGRRGALMTKFPEQLPPGLPTSVRHLDFVPFSSLLPRAAALVHHGGIGTCAQGLASGLPQVIMPMAYDQLDNGLRLQRLGVGEIVPREKFEPPAVSSALAPLLESSEVATRCRDYANRCNGPASLGAACELLEELHQRRTDRDTVIPSAAKNLEP